MTPEQVARIRPRLETFAGQMLGPALRRVEQRTNGELYLRGLLTDGSRKSMQPMAQRLGVDHQRLQQFVSSSTWDYTVVRANLARWAVDTVGPDAYVVDDVGFPKDGDASPGVARQYCGALGKTGNCQVGVSVHLVTDTASAAVNWRLFLPESWDDTTTTDPQVAAWIRARRARSKIGEDVRHVEKWRLALDMLDEMTGAEMTGAEMTGAEMTGAEMTGAEMTGGWQLPADRPVVADCGYGDATGFRLGLTERGLTYVVAVKPVVSAYAADAVPLSPAYSGRGRPPVPRYRDDPANLRLLALAAGRGALRQVTWRHGTRRTKGNPTAKMRSRFLAIRVRPANRDIPRAADGSLPTVWLLAEWPPGEDEPTNYWLSTLPATTPIKTLVHLAKIRWRIEHDYRELKSGLGLDHFEGRSYSGWHRHVTLTALAQAFCTLLRLDPKADAPA